MPDSENSNYNKDFEANNNLVGFFELLLKIDKRVSPHLYENNQDKDNN